MYQLAAFLISASCLACRAPEPAASFASASAPALDGAEPSGLSVEVETLDLPNGMRVTLYEDHSLPKVVINTWFSVGSKDEVAGRTGFAHLFEHLMFMGTDRVPGGQFDLIMESGGGFNNASTSQDRTNYFSQGPSSLLPTLLWLDADRFETLDDAMTQEKLDTQRGVVRNERRQTSEDVPYGRAELMLPELLYPDGHPYQHSVIGSHEDLEAARLEDVVEFFRTYYVPANASLVIAGDFDHDAVVKLVRRTMGALEPRPVPKQTSAAPVVLPAVKRALTYDDVELPKLILAWHSPAFMTEGDGAMDLLGGILAGGSATRLERRLVIETGLAQEVAAYQSSAELGSTFRIEVTAAAGADLDRIESEVFDVLGELTDPGDGGLRAAELERVQAQMERGFLQRSEDLLARADSINRYLHYWDEANGFQRDLERWTSPDVEDVRRWAERVLSAGHVDLRVLPSDDAERLGELVVLSEGGTGSEWRAGGSLDDRPKDFARRGFTPPVPITRTLSNGVKVVLHARPGTRLFSGVLHVPGGESIVSADRAGLASLTARLLNQGAAGLDTTDWAQEVESLGASIEADAGREDLSISVSGLTSRLDETLDRYAEVVLDPNLRTADFEREKGLLLGEIARRADNPHAVAGLASRALLFGSNSHRGRPVDGFESTVSPLALEDVVGAWSALVSARDATFVFVGDFEPEALVTKLEARFADLDARVVARAEQEPASAFDPATPPPPLDMAGAGRTVLIDKPGAAQTVMLLMRPLTVADGQELADRTALNIALGGSFTSRLNLNLRERNHFSYGAGSRISREGDQVLFLASSAVQTDVTGAALREFRNEFDGIAGGDLDDGELAKAVESARTDLMQGFSTTRAIARTLAELVANGRPLDAKGAELAALDRVDLAEVNRLARSGLFDWKKLQVVMVGDAESVRAQLEEAGFEPALEADTEGRLLD